MMPLSWVPDEWKLRHPMRQQSTGELSRVTAHGVVTMRLTASVFGWFTLKTVVGPRRETTVAGLSSASGAQACLKYAVATMVADALIPADKEPDAPLHR